MKVGGSDEGSLAEDTSERKDQEPRVIRDMHSETLAEAVETRAVIRCTENRVRQQTASREQHV